MQTSHSDDSKIRTGYSSFVDLIDTLPQAGPGRGITLIDGRFKQTEHSYHDLHRRVMAFARHYQEQGLGHGQRVLIALPTELDAISSLFAVIYLGAIPYSISSPLMGQNREAHLRQVARMMKLHDVDRYLASRDLAGLDAVGVTDAKALGCAESPTERELTATCPIAPANVSPDDTAFVQFSSGSTSHPKGVPVAHRSLIYNLELIANCDRRTTETVWVSWLPLYHDMGLVGGLLTNLLLKNDLVLMDPVCFVTRPISWLRAISEHRGNVAAVPNFALDICHDRISDEELDEHAINLESFRYIYCGAEPVHTSSILRFEQRFGERGLPKGAVYPVYGMSETTLIVSAPAFDEPLVTSEYGGRALPAVGYPLGDFEVAIRDDEGNDLGPSDVGEIWIKGTSVTAGYLPAGSADDLIIDGFLATGDLGFLDDEGRLSITGRRKDLIILQGRNFYGHDIAARIEDLPYVSRGKVFAFGYQDGHHEQVVVLAGPARTKSTNGEAITTFEDVEGYKTAIRKHVMHELGLMIDDIAIVPKLPKTTSGKFARHRCEELYRQHKKTQAETAAPDSV